MFEIVQSTDGLILQSFLIEFEQDVTVDGYEVPTLAICQACLESPEIRLLLVLEDGVIVGGVLITGNELHTMFRKVLRGRRALLAGQAVLDWVSKTIDLPAVTSYFYSHRPEVGWFAKRLGFIEQGEPFNDGSTFREKPVLRTNLVKYLKCQPSQ